MSSLRTWIFPSLASALIISGLAACTVSTGPSTDDGSNRKDDDKNTSSSSSSGSTSSSSSGGSSSSSGAVVEVTCEIKDLVDTSQACGACTLDNCLDNVRECFSCSDNAAGVGKLCDAYLDEIAAKCDGTGPEAEYQACVDAAATASPDSAASYNRFSACQVDKCKTECGLN